MKRIRKFFSGVLILNLMLISLISANTTLSVKGEAHLVDLKEGLEQIPDLRDGLEQIPDLDF